MTRHLWLGFAAAAAAVAVALAIGVFTPRSTFESSLRVRLTPDADVATNDRQALAVERLAEVQRVPNTLAEIVELYQPADPAISIEAEVDEESSDVTVSAYGDDTATNAQALASAVAEGVPAFVGTHHLFDVEVIDSSLSHEVVMSTVDATRLLITIVVGAFAASYSVIAGVRYLRWRPARWRR